MTMPPTAAAACVAVAGAAAGAAAAAAAAVSAAVLVQPGVGAFAPHPTVTVIGGPGAVPH